MAASVDQFMLFCDLEHATFVFPCKRRCDESTFLRAVVNATGRNADLKTKALFLLWSLLQAFWFPKKNPPSPSRFLIK